MALLKKHCSGLAVWNLSWSILLSPPSSAAIKVEKKPLGVGSVTSWSGYIELMTHVRFPNIRQSLDISNWVQTMDRFETFSQRSQSSFARIVLGKMYLRVKANSSLSLFIFAQMSTLRQIFWQHFPVINRRFAAGSSGTATTPSLRSEYVPEPYQALLNTGSLADSRRYLVR